MQESVSWLERTANNRKVRGSSPRGTKCFLTKMAMHRMMITIMMVVMMLSTMMTVRASCGIRINDLPLTERVLCQLS